MRYFWTFFWTFLLVQMLTYVAGSMIGVPYEFETGSILAVIVAVFIFVIPTIIPSEPQGKNSLH